MRLLAVGVRNFRGVRERTVNLAPVGVTIIEGPNEVGKTSLADAVDLLITYADSSRTQEVRDTQPIGEDVATEIWVEMEVGPYGFRYHKRYHKNPATTLDLTAPRHEQVTGRAAHDRVQEILAAHADLTLWTALKIQQRPAERRGEKPPQLTEAPSLRAALDREAGGVERPAADTLMERVEREYLRYYTLKAGRPTTTVFGPLESAVQAAEQQVADLDQKIAAAEADEERLRRLEGERQVRLGQYTEGEELARTWGQRLRDVVDLEGRHRDALQRETTLTTQHGDWTARLARRRQLAETEAAGQARLAELELQRETAAAALAAAQQELGRQRLVQEEARAARDRARRREDRAILDEQDVARRRQAAVLEKRVEAVGRLEQELADLEARRAKVTIAGDELQEIRQQAKRLAAAEATLAVGSPTVEVRAPHAETVQVNGEARPLSAHESVRFPVQEAVTLEWPDGHLVTVRPGATVSELQRRRERAHEQLMARLAPHQLADAESAERAVQRATDWERDMERRRQALDEVLAGEAADALRAALRELRAGQRAYEQERPDEFARPADAEAAAQETAAAREQVRAAEERLALVAATTAGMDKAQTHAVRECERLDAERAETSTGLAAVQAQLAEAAGESMEALAQAVAESAEALQQARRHTEGLQTQLTAINPDTVRLQEDNARALVNRTREQVQQLMGELAECRGRLEQAGRDEWYEKRPMAVQALATAQHALSEVQRQAAAAHWLYHTLVQYRDAQQRAYRQPLAQAIVDLGRVVYGADLAVEVDDTLSVARRTLGGQTLDVKHLSAGAREQMLLLERLAAARLVAPDEGAPVILDDTLGFTDDERLRQMAAVLGHVGQQCQVIILTSSAHRYAGIGRANRIVMDRADGGRGSF